MQSKDIEMIRHCLPEEMAFPYYADRESPWLLAQTMPEALAVADLTHGSLARFAARPLVRPMLTVCGGGVLPRADVLAVGHAARAMRLPQVGPAGHAGLEAAFALPWHDFLLSVTSWGTGGESWNQISGKGGNLVLQLGFPSDHADLMGRYLAKSARKDFEFCAHPIRQSGRPTLAWARLDIDLARGVALIEEIQSDWLRFAREERDWLQSNAPKSRHLQALMAYEAGLRARYDKIWPRAMMLAVLVLLRDEFACREVWMHQPEPGAVLKGIGGTLPPRSLYTRLPKAFGFAPTQDAPAFLERICRRKLAKLRRGPDPVFWRLRFDQDMGR